MKKADNQFLLEEYRKLYCKKTMPVVGDTRDKPVSSYLLFNDNQHNLLQYRHVRNLNHQNNILKILRENESNKNYLQEGLIQTYPMQKFIQMFKSWFRNNIDEKLQSLRFSDVADKHYATAELNGFFNEKLIDVADIANEEDFGDDAGIVTFYIPFYESIGCQKLLESLVDAAYRYGYNLASNETIDFDNGFKKTYDVKIMYATFEAKFSHVDFEFSEYLYHVAPYNLVHKIKKNGLIPKSKHSFFKYPDRVYLFNNCDMRLILNYGIDKTVHNDQKKFALLRIDSAKLQQDDLFRSGKMLFYVDQKYAVIDKKKPIAIYTCNNIPRRLIDDKILLFEIDDDQIIVNKKAASLEILA